MSWLWIILGLLVVGEQRLLVLGDSTGYVTGVRSKQNSIAATRVRYLLHVFGILNKYEQ